MLKKMITEKDLRRQISLLELLLNHPQITAKEIAQQLKTTERTVFSDLQLIREQLPAGWQISADSQGIQLILTENQLANQLWDLFLPQSISIQLIKALFFEKELATSKFLAENGVSLETLKRHTNKINRQLKPYEIKIKVSAKTAELIGNESAVRIFFHRLLLPFTHNNYFFEEYSIHEGHYFDYLKKLNRSPLAVDTEQIFGVCWFFINTIRVKANCPIDEFKFNQADFLYQQYQTSLAALYQLEGIYLQEAERFFAFFCFLESWNYNNSFGAALDLTQAYPQLGNVAEQLASEITQRQQLDFQKTQLTENLLLLLLKYNESTWLSEQFQLEYQELLAERKEHAASDQKLLALIDSVVHLDNPLYLLNLISLLEQQAVFAARPQVMTLYFIFQGEPAWKAFLQQELADAFGRRVKLVSVEISQLTELNFNENDIVVSNFPLAPLAVEVVYISSLPTKNELRQLTELTWQHYL
ncbi:helix-turn-helix domain-containing protein [Enterococcus sp. LJL90]